MPGHRHQTQTGNGATTDVAPSSYRTAACPITYLVLATPPAWMSSVNERDLGPIAWLAGLVASDLQVLPGELARDLCA